MPKSKSPSVNYDNRDVLDTELERAISEILSAEAEARRIIEQAAESVKAVQLDGATRERDMRAAAVLYARDSKATAVKKSNELAETECERLINQAEKTGAELYSSKKSDIRSIADELYRSLFA